MTPMADLLNARYGCNNARLFYEDKKYLRMIATKPIKKGDQIWNTYGDPPNSDLVRRYGHTDYIETPQGLGNPADVVELSADIITGIIKPPMEKERVDLFLEEGGDDVFAFDAAFDLPDDFLVFIRLLSLNESEWKKAQEKNKLPKPKKDLATLQVAEKAVVKRMEVYPTSLEDDEKINLEGLSFNKRNAVIVRMGEKRILRGVLYNIQQEISRLNIAKGSEKRKRNSDKGTESRKKNKRQ
ncbi:hypothetical protein FRC03_009413 [Tulasnella sp. 419]|nr:hypothetical protein FRC03_009413 [Tulasnella sp. 419]